MRCEKHKDHRLPVSSCPVCVLDERNCLRAENEALREAGREVLGSLAPLRLGGMPLDSRMYEAVSRLETLLAAHDRGGK